jgi:excisionase family DNA binding protein
MTHHYSPQKPPATGKDMTTATVLGWLSPAAAARYLGVSAQFIYDACASKGLRHAKLAGRRNIRIRPEWLDTWMSQHEQVNTA